MYILGINAFHPDASVALLKDGKLIFAVEEERLNRIKHSAGFPRLAVVYCLKKAGITLRDIDHIAFTNDPKANLCRKAVFVLTHFSPFSWPKFAAQYTRARLSKMLTTEDALAEACGVEKKDIRAKIWRVEHHRAHAASSYYVSGFSESAIMTLDGAGDFLTGIMAKGDGPKMRIIKRLSWPHSIGIFYSGVTQYLGFLHAGDEGKVMGLAAYGRPVYTEQFKKIIKLTKGGFKLNLDYFLHHKPEVVDRWGTPHLTSGDYSYEVSEKFHELFGPRRMPQDQLEQRHKDIACSLQAVFEGVIFHLLNHLYELTHSQNLCLGGGTFLNCLLNGKIRANTPYKRVFVQPGAGDGGSAIGNCFYIYHQMLNQPRQEAEFDAYAGPEYKSEEIEAVLRKFKLKYERGSVEKKAAGFIADGKIIGWFQGRTEFGPRALGNRSILVDPRREEMKDILNSRVKFREWFRPFAPAVLAEHCGEYFDDTSRSPFMLFASSVLPDKQKIIPAVTHIDGTARAQTVDKSANPRLRMLIEEFYRLTGVPLVLNTSFNTRGEPMVCSPEDAVKTFLSTEMDVLVMGDYLIKK